MKQTIEFTSEMMSKTKNTRDYPSRSKAEKFGTSNNLSIYADINCTT